MEFVIGGRLNKQIAAISASPRKPSRRTARVMEKLETRSVTAVVRMCELVGIKPRRTNPH